MKKNKYAALILLAIIATLLTAMPIQYISIPPGDFIRYDFGFPSIWFSAYLRPDMQIANVLDLFQYNIGLSDIHIGSGLFTNIFLYSLLAYFVNWVVEHTRRKVPCLPQEGI